MLNILLPLEKSIAQLFEGSSLICFMFFLVQQHFKMRDLNL